MLVKNHNKEQLKKWRKSQLFFCPQCEKSVQLKIGEVVIPHFAHRKNDACPLFFSEGETQEHLLGKQQLYMFLQKHIEDVELEPYFKMLAQRPDLLAWTGNKRIPIEFQCSTIPVIDIETRSAGYRSIGMDPIWILRTPAKFSTSPTGVSIIHLSKFEEYFITRSSPEGRRLLTYNPQTERFHYFSSLLHVAGNRHIGIHRTLPISMQTFPFARPKTPTIEELHKYATIYGAMRMHFLESRILLNRRGVNNPFLRSCYDLRILPIDLPSWIGLPVAESDAFREHDCEWQLGLFHYMRREGISLEGLTLGKVKRYVARLDNPSERKERACMAYRNFLVSMGIVPFKNSRLSGANDIYTLIADRFLAKQYED